jgi:hypothetical protein
MIHGNSEIDNRFQNMNRKFTEPAGIRKPAYMWFLWFLKNTAKAGKGEQFVSLLFVRAGRPLVAAGGGLRFRCSVLLI